MRLIGISFIVMVFLGLIMGSVHFWGLGRPHPPFPTEFFDKPEFTKSKPWLIIPEESAKKLNLKPEQWPFVILNFNVYQDREGTLFVATEDEFKKLGNTITAPESKVLLVDKLKEHGSRRVLLNIKSNAQDIDQKISAIVGDKNTNVAIHSDYDIVMQSIKDQRPNLVFGSSQSDLMRFRSFQSLLILTATPFKGDFFLSAIKWRNVETLNQDIVTELKRRNKKVFIGPLESADQLALAKSLGADGLFIREEGLIDLALREIH